MYKDMFTSLIHSRTDVARIHKFRYLKTTLKDEPLQIVSAVEESEKLNRKN